MALVQKIGQVNITLSMTACTLYDPPRSIMTIDLSTQFITTATGLLRAEGAS